MRVHELDAIKNIASSFKYEEDLSVPLKESTEDKFKIMKKISESFVYEKESLKEETFDDFDTVYEALKTGVEMEMKGFIVNLLMNNAENFAWSFVSPTSETFKDAWDHVLTKFTLRDLDSQNQFLERMKILFRNIFIEKFGISDEATALTLADKYFEVFSFMIHSILDKMKDNIEGETIPTAQDATNDQLTYR